MFCQMKMQSSSQICYFQKVSWNQSPVHRAEPSFIWPIFTGLLGSSNTMSTSGVTKASDASIVDAAGFNGLVVLQHANERCLSY